MKSAFVILIAAVVLAACSTPDSPENRKSNYNIVYEPERGVLCDRVEQACYDGKGPTLAATEKYLGPEAAQKFQRELDRVGAENVRSMELSDHVFCSYKSRLCMKKRFSDDVAPHHTKALFGEY